MGFFLLENIFCICLMKQMQILIIKSCMNTIDCQRLFKLSIVNSHSHVEFIGLLFLNFFYFTSPDFRTIFELCPVCSAIFTISQLLPVVMLNIPLNVQLYQCFPSASEPPAVHTNCIDLDCHSLYIYCSNRKPKMLPHKWFKSNESIFYYNFIGQSHVDHN